jgi:hypothetical protein
MCTRTAHAKRHSHCTRTIFTLSPFLCECRLPLRDKMRLLRSWQPIPPNVCDRLTPHTQAQPCNTPLLLRRFPLRCATSADTPHWQRCLCSTHHCVPAALPRLWSQHPSPVNAASVAAVAAAGNSANGAVANAADSAPPPPTATIAQRTAAAAPPPPRPAQLS